MHTNQSVHQLFESFEKQSVLVIGDVMIDAYIFGKVERISPEAPVPVVAVQERQNRPGGAANVALNIKSLGANAILCSVIGNDLKGNEFKDILLSNKLPLHGLVSSQSRITTTKFRIIGNKTQMLRVDDEMTHDLSRGEQAQLWNRIKDILHHEKIDVILFQDYNKGVITRSLINSTMKLAREKGIPVVVDPKHKNFLAYKNVSLFKPNLKELKEGLDLTFDTRSIPETAKALALLHQKLHADMVMVTMSEKGVLIGTKSGSDEHTITHIPAFMRNIADVSGAGDTVISVASLCLASGLSGEDIATISNLAGGLVCEEIGVVPIDKNKLLEEVLNTMVR
ncbi:MAG: bifunctional ADP-heptose synthase [Bacteroidales bacterium]|nr:bifunctional ADP-heptose synthase [Bacteroidales bacterium]